MDAPTLLPAGSPGRRSNAKRRRHKSLQVSDSFQFGPGRRPAAELRSLMPTNRGRMHQQSGACRLVPRPKFLYDGFENPMYCF